MSTIKSSAKKRCDQLKSLTVQRRAHVESLKNNKDGSHEIIARLYADPSHFIYELLQNADDARASKVRFNLSVDALEFEHNGDKLFTFKDVESITTIGSSTKGGDINPIGKFGVGFKSVFAVTRAPEIYSQDFNFRIIDFIVPEEIPEKSIHGKRTITRLPFNHPDLLQTEAYKQTLNELEALQSESLLFLQHIKTITWKTETVCGEYKVKHRNGAKRSLLSSVGERNSRSDYLLFSSNAKIGKKTLRLSIAYKLSDSGASITAVNDSALFVFFPTKEIHGLKFLVHVPYKTTPTREAINFDDKDNKTLTRALRGLVADSIRSIKKIELLDINFLSLLPIDEIGAHLLYQAAFEKVKDLLSKERLLPMAQCGGYTVAGNALLARGKQLTELLNADDCGTLFERGSWIDAEVTTDNTPELRRYLMDHLDVPEINMEKFCHQLNENFLSGKSDEWLIEFYTNIADNPSLYRYPSSALRKKPIIRLQENEHVCPEGDDGELQVYLPAIGRESGFKTIKSNIASNKKARDFFQALGVTVPGNVAEVKECIASKYANDSTKISKQEYMRDFSSAFNIWASCQEESQKRRIVEILGDVNFIRAVDYEGNFSLRRPNDVYDSNELLQVWFSGNDEDELYFVDDALISDEGHKEFVHALGVQSKPRECGTGEYGGIGKKPIERHHYAKGIDGFNPEFNIAGLKFSMHNVNLDRSVYIFCRALEHVNKLSGIVHESSRQYFDGGWHNAHKSERSIAGRLLVENFWLYDKDGCLIDKQLLDISVDDLHDDYDKAHRNIEKLEKSLGLKSDVIRRFEEEHGGKLVPIDEYHEFKRWEEEQAKRKEQKTGNSWEADALPEEVEAECAPYYPQRISVDFSGQNSSDESRDEDEHEHDVGDETENTGDNVSDSDRKKIGDWGERFVQKHIEKAHPGADVVWLNSGGDRGKGCDYVVRKNGHDICYYEVKSRTDETPQLFKVTGTQWAFAQKLHLEGKGEQYRILLVGNAGSPKATLKEIKNPVGLWGAGKLYAHPVNIRLP